MKDFVLREVEGKWRATRFQSPRFCFEADTRNGAAALARDALTSYRDRKDEIDRKVEEIKRNLGL